MGATTPYFIPSYLDLMNGEDNFQRFADSMMHIGPVRFRTINALSHDVTKADVDWVLRFDGEARVYVPEDPQLDVPVGTQFAVLNYSDQRVVIKGVGDCHVLGPVRNVVPPWRVGVLVKHDANFWLLSLGSGASGTAATPTAPILKTAVPGNKAVTLTWDPPADDGGYPVLGYTAQISKDERDWVEKARVTDPAARTTTLTGLAPGKTFFRVLAFNEVGEGDPSNILDASPLLPPPDVTHVGNGVFAIVGYDKSNEYVVTATAGTVSVNASGQVVSTGATNCVITLKVRFGGSESLPIYMQRRAYEYHKENHPDCHTDCRYAGWNCFHCDGDCVGCQ